MKSADIARLGEAFAVPTAPEPLEAPYLVAWNPSLGFEDPGVEAMAGAKPWGEPVALRYAGHQFGVYVPQLGDGRALLLGEERGLEVQLKGSGRTVFSRGGDGRAVLRSTIREYLASEAMHGLGLPTTRALAIVGSDQPVFRETVETAAILVRLARSHVRFGSFEMFAHLGRPELVRALADLCLPLLGVASHVELLRETVTRTARLIAAWQAAGFTHGVMNSDNMSLLGLTLDYGPYAFMEATDLDFVPNHSDHEGRYAYGNQPKVALWNLGCLARALVPLVGEAEARAAVATYGDQFALAHEEAFARKLGLRAWRGEDDEQLLRGLLRVMSAARVDWPNFFRALPELDAARALFADPRGFDAWAGFYRERLDGEPWPERADVMRRTNPKYVLRTHLAQRAIERAQAKDFTEIERLRRILAAPFDDQPEHDLYAHPAPAGGPERHLSCSS